MSFVFSKFVDVCLFVYTFFLGFVGSEQEARFLALNNTIMFLERIAVVLNERNKFFEVIKHEYQNRQKVLSSIKDVDKVCLDSNFDVLLDRIFKFC